MPQYISNNLNALQKRLDEIDSKLEDVNIFLFQVSVGKQLLHFLWRATAVIGGIIISILGILPIIKSFFHNS